MFKYKINACGYCDSIEIVDYLLGVSSQMKQCSKCRLTYYCNKECQTKHWKTHKTCCVNHNNLKSNVNNIMNVITNNNTYWTKICNFYNKNYAKLGAGFIYIDFTLDKLGNIIHDVSQSNPIGIGYRFIPTNEDKNIQHILSKYQNYFFLVLNIIFHDKSMCPFQWLMPREQHDERINSICIEKETTDIIKNRKKLIKSIHNMAKDNGTQLSKDMKRKINRFLHNGEKSHIDIICLNNKVIRAILDDNSNNIKL